jgi:hypothetical protein
MAANDPDNQQIAAELAGAGVDAVGTQAARAAADATDTWITDNQTSFNTALPEPFKSTATSAQKTLLFCYVAMKRAGLI